MNSNVKNEEFVKCCEEFLLQEDGAWTRSFKQAIQKAKDYVSANAGEELDYQGKQIEDLEQAIRNADTLDQIQAVTKFGNYEGSISFEVLNKEKKESVLQEGILPFWLNKDFLLHKDIDAFTNAADMPPEYRLQLGVFCYALMYFCEKIIDNKKAQETIEGFKLLEKGHTRGFEVNSYVMSEIYKIIEDRLKDNSAIKNAMESYKAELEKEAPKMAVSDDDLDVKARRKNLEYGLYKLETLFSLNMDSMNTVLQNVRFYEVKEDNRTMLMLKSNNFKTSLIYDDGQNLISVNDLFDLYESKVIELFSGDGKPEDVLSGVGQIFERELSPFLFKLDGAAFKFSNDDFKKSIEQQSANIENKDSEAHYSGEIDDEVLGALSKSMSNDDYHFLLNKVVSHIVSEFKFRIYENPYTIKFEKEYPVSENKKLVVKFDFHAVDEKKVVADDRHKNPYKKHGSVNVTNYIAHQLEDKDFSHFDESGKLKFDGEIKGLHVVWDLTLTPFVSKSGNADLENSIDKMQSSIESRMKKLKDIVGVLPEKDGVIDEDQMKDSINKTKDIVEKTLTGKHLTKNGKAAFLSQLGDVSNGLFTKRLANEVFHLLDALDSSKKNLDKYKKDMQSELTRRGLEIKDSDVKNKQQLENDFLKVKNEFQSKLYKYGDEIKKEFEKKRRELLDACDKAAESVASLADSIIADKQNLEKAHKRLSGNMITKDNSRVVNAWKENLLDIFKRSDNFSSKLLPMPETVGDNAYRVNTAMSFHDIEDDKDYKYRLLLNFKVEA